MLAVSIAAQRLYIDKRGAAILIARTPIALFNMRFNIILIAEMAKSCRESLYI